MQVHSHIVIKYMINKIFFLDLNHKTHVNNKVLIDEIKIICQCINGS